MEKVLGFTNVRLSGAGADGGIDVHAHEGVAQVKDHGNPVGARYVRELKGVSGTGRSVFYARSGYTAPSISDANRLDIALFEYNLAGTYWPRNGAARQLQAGYLTQQRNELAAKAAAEATYRRMRARDTITHELPLYKARVDRAYSSRKAGTYRDGCIRLRSDRVMSGALEELGRLTYTSPAAKAAQETDSADFRDLEHAVTAAQKHLAMAAKRQLGTGGYQRSINRAMRHWRKVFNHVGWFLRDDAGLPLLSNPDHGYPVYVASRLGKGLVQLLVGTVYVLVGGWKIWLSLGYIGTVVWLFLQGHADWAGFMVGIALYTLWQVAKLRR
ncbi:hypothetical protein GCM10023198_42410 [Promicromonospora umidemergens]|uniref:Restriction endonuclease type IV Mrr domain-containing protein n=2 Tax=Promicromonospora umidemergens TaxID=629679 RepID=A0ABP8XU83_9MICO